MNNPKILVLIVLIMISAIMSGVYSYENNKTITEKDKRIEQLLEIAQKTEDKVTVGFEDLKRTLKEFGVKNPKTQNIEELFAADDLRTKIKSTNNDYSNKFIKLTHVRT